MLFPKPRPGTPLCLQRPRASLCREQTTITLLIEKRLVDSGDSGHYFHIINLCPQLRPSAVAKLHHTTQQKASLTAPCSLDQEGAFSPLAGHQGLHQGGHKLLLVAFSSHLVDQAQAFRRHVLTQLWKDRRGMSWRQGHRVERWWFFSATEKLLPKR